MSFYPANEIGNVFNADDFISSDEIIEDQNGSTNDVNLNEYVKKTGSIMSGTLQVPQLIINNANSLAYTTSEKAKLDDNTNKLQNITKTATHTEISNLKCADIQFTNAKQNQAFTDADKTQIYNNQGSIITNASNITSNSGNITSNSANIVANSNSITANTNSITANTNAITANTNDIATNTNDIATNTQKLEPFTNETDAVVMNKLLFFDDRGYIGTFGGGLYIKNAQSSNNIVLDSGSGDSYVTVWSQALKIGRSNGGRIIMNGATQNHCFTDLHKSLVEGIQNGTTTNPIITQNQSDIVDLQNSVSSLTTNSNSIQVYQFPLTMNDLLGVSSISNNQEINITHSFDLLEKLYSLGLHSDIKNYPGYTWNTTKRFEINFQAKFKSHNSTIYKIQSGLRNLSGIYEDATTSDLIDSGIFTNSNMFETYRYNYNAIIDGANNNLYNLIQCLLKTTLHINSASTGTIELTGHMTVKVF